MAIIQCSGFKIGSYYIPKFKLEEGELLGICLWGGHHYFELKHKLINILTSENKHDNLELTNPFLYTPHFIEPTFRRLFLPVSVGEYVQKNAKAKETRIILEKLQQYPYITQKTKVQALGLEFRRILSLYCTLTHSKWIVFDLDGQDEIGAERTCSVVKESIRNGGSAILIDWTNSSFNHCTKSIKITS